ncbi:MAG: hypothetical protein AAFU34_15700 [Pseudomonadota bacterium]
MPKKGETVPFFRDQGGRRWWAPSKALRERGYTNVVFKGMTRAAAMDAARALNRKALATKAATSSTPTRQQTISLVIGTYIKRSVSFREKSQITQEGYRRDLAVVENKWGSTAVTAVRRGAVFEWYETLYIERGPSAARHIIAAFSAAMQYAVQRSWIETNPCHDLGIKQGKPRRVYVEDDRSMTTFITELDDDFALFIALLYFQGQRGTDARLARVADFKRHGDELRWHLTRSKRGTFSSLLIHPRTERLLTPRLEARAERTYLFGPEDTDEPFNRYWASTRWSRVRERHKDTHPELLNIQLRDLRRSWSVNARKAGADLRQVEEVLGNTAAVDPVLKEVYMPPTETTTDAAMRAVIKGDHDDYS